MRTEHIAGENTPTAVLPRECAPKTVDALLADIRRRPIVQPESLSLQDSAACTGYSEQQFSEFVKRGVALKSPPIQSQRAALQAQRHRRVVRSGQPECLFLQGRARRCAQMNAKIDRVPVVINRNLVFGDLEFTNSRDRCLYIGNTIRGQPRWLDEHAGSCWRIVDGQREAAALAPPAESETNVGAAPPAPKQPPPDQTAMRESVRSQTEAAPLEAVVRKRSRSGSRHLKKQKLPAEIFKVGRKRTPACMLLFLDILAECRVLSVAARKAGIHPKTPAYWCKRSAAGDAGYYVEWRGETRRFHEHCQSAIEEAEDIPIDAAWDMAMGGVVYKYDELLLSLDYVGHDAYLRDENGAPVVETVREKNPKMLRLYLAWRLPDEFGKRRKIDIPRNCSVLVIGATPKKFDTSKATAASIKARQWKSRSRIIRQAKSDSPALKGEE